MVRAWTHPPVDAGTGEWTFSHNALVLTGIIDEIKNTAAHDRALKRMVCPSEVKGEEK
jgi:hypothetical protein